MRLATFSRGQTVTKQGDFGDVLYILFEGTVEVFIDDAYECDLGEKELIGECAMTHSKRTATVIAKTPIKCIELREEDYRRNIINQKYDQQSEVIKFLTEIPIFKGWP